MSTEAITRTTINRVRRRARRGELVEVHDLIQPGLSIRATGRRLSWYFRCTTRNQREDGKGVRTAYSICTVDTCPDPASMRKVVGAGFAALEEGRDPIAAVRTALAAVLNLPETRVAGSPSLQTWSFNTFREEFKRDPPSDLRKDTVDGYYRALSKTQVGEDIYAKRLVEVTPQDIRSIRDAIRRRGHNRQSALTLQALRTAFEWATESTRSVLSGLSEDNNPMLRVVTKRRRNKRKPTNEESIAAADLIKVDEDQNLIVEDPTLMTMLDIGKFLLLLLRPEALPLVKRAILLLLTYSVQRRRTVASAIRKAFVGFVKQDVAWWVLDGGTTKAGRMHILPFSAKAWDVIESWMKMLPATSVWLFPGMATRRKPIPTGHINVRTVNEWVYEAYELAGCSRRHNPHAIRTAFGTYLSTRGIKKAQRKLILDHSEGRGSDVTEVHYNFDPRLPEKQEIMMAWNSFLDECVKLARKSNDREKCEETKVAPARALEDQSYSASIALPSPPRIPQPQSRLQARPDGQHHVGASDASRLEQLRAKLGSRKKLDQAFESTFRKRLPT